MTLVVQNRGAEALEVSGGRNHGDRWIIYTDTKVFKNQDRDGIKRGVDIITKKRRRGSRILKIIATRMGGG